MDGLPIVDLDLSGFPDGTVFFTGALRWFFHVPLFLQVQALGVMRHDDVPGVALVVAHVPEGNIPLVMTADEDVAAAVCRRIVGSLEAAGISQGVEFDAETMELLYGAQRDEEGKSG